MTASVKPEYDINYDHVDAVAKEVYDKLYNEREQLRKQIMSGATASNAITSATLNSVALGSGVLAQTVASTMPYVPVTTHNAGKSWDAPKNDIIDNERLKRYMVVDIGVDANAAIITLDDISTIEIRSINKDTTLSEITDLNLLNGTYLSDIVVTQHRSLITRSIGQLKIIGVNGAKVVFDVQSENSWVVNFEVIVKESNAVRKQTPTI